MSPVPSITIVEDDAAIREMYALKLRAQGYDVSTANDGLEGLEVIQKHLPDLILLDIRMPHMPGHEMLRRMRAEEWGQDAKVIVLTNISRDEAPTDFRFLGVSRYIVKVHHTPKQVMEIIEEVLAE